MYHRISVFHWLQNMRAIQDIMENTHAPMFDPTHGLVPQTNSALGSLGIGGDGKSCSEIVGKCFKHRIPMLSGWRVVKDPRDETYCDSLTEHTCPTSRLISVTSAILLLQICTFVASAILGINKQGRFLSISPESMTLMRAMTPISVFQGDIYRCLVSLFLHRDFEHLFIELIATIAVANRIEYTYGPLRTALIYLVSGISGNLIFCCTTVDPLIPSVGSLAAIYGLAATHLGYLVLNWKGLEFLGELLRYHLVGLVLFNGTVGAAMGLSVARSTDVLQTAGAITGFLLAATLPTVLEERAEKRMRGLFIGFAGLINILIILGVYLIIAKQYR